LFTRIKKGDLFLFPSLSFFHSFSHFTMIHKKRSSLLSSKIETDSSNYGKIDIFESIYWYLHLPFIIIFNSKPSHFMVLWFYMCQQWKWKSTGIISFLQKKAKAHKSLDYRYGLEQTYSFQKVTTIKLMSSTLFSEWRHFNTIYHEKFGVGHPMQNQQGNFLLLITLRGISKLRTNSTATK
jgi:hypothetical protein